eukprot:4419328-Pyramimonas_sp.AAC.1
MAWSFKAQDVNAAARAATDARITNSGMPFTHGKQIQEMSKRQDSFEARMAVLEGTGSVGSSESTTVEMPRQLFTPAYVECYGRVQYWSSALTRSRSMIADDQAEALVKNVIERIHAADESVSAHIDTDVSKRAAMSKPMSGSGCIRFKKGTEEGVIFQALAILIKVNDDPAQRPKLFHGMTSPPVRIRFRVEAPPGKFRIKGSRSFLRGVGQAGP